MSAESTTTTAPPYLIGRAEVTRVHRISPTFVRVTFSGPEIADLATPGAIWDLRIKLIFPTPGVPLPHVPVEAGWYAGWVALPETERGSMRTYSIRELREDGDRTEVDIDFVLHLAPGLSGPASRWADAARIGDEILIAGPRRGHDWGGIEYAPGTARTILLAGDETAAPAIARTLEDSAPDTVGIAFIEVPQSADALPISAPTGVEVRWLPRGDEPHGTVLIPTVLGFLGTAPDGAISDVETESLVWETPTFSGLGESIAPDAPHADRYFWIAGESGVVTTLRRHLVKDLGIDRSQVSFMGYWRRGVAMKG